MDLSKGIVLPFRFWRNGRTKEIIAFIFWRNVILPLGFCGAIIKFFVEKEWIIALCLLFAFFCYWILGAMICRREKGNCILKEDGVTFVTQRGQIYFPWSSISNVETINRHRYGFELRFMAGKKKYYFYERYRRKQICDEEGGINLNLAPICVISETMKSILSGLH